MRSHIVQPKLGILKRWIMAAPSLVRAVTRRRSDETICKAVFDKHLQRSGQLLLCSLHPAEDSILLERDENASCTCFSTRYPASPTNR